MSTNFNGIIFDDEQPSGGNYNGIIFDDDPVAPRIPKESISTLKELGILDKDGNVSPLSNDARAKMESNIHNSERRVAAKWASDNKKDGVFDSLSAEEKATISPLVLRGLEGIKRRAEGDVDSARARLLQSFNERLSNEEDFDPMSVDSVMHEMGTDYKDMSPAARDFIKNEAILSVVGGDQEKYEKEYLPSLTPEQRNEEAIRVRNILNFGNQSQGEEQLNAEGMGALEKVQNDFQAKYGVKASKGYSAAVAATPFANTAISVADMFITKDLEKLMKGDFNLDEVLNSGKFDSFKEAYDSGEWSKTKTKNMIKLAAYEMLRDKTQNQGEASAERERRGVSTWGTIGAGGMEVLALGGEFMTPIGAAGKGASLATKAGVLAARSAVPFASSAARRYSGLRTNDYSFDEKGNLYVSDKADSVGTAAAKSAVGAAAEVAIEKVGGEFLGKVVGATGGRLVGKMAGSNVGQAVAKNSIVRGVGKVVKFAKTPLETLGWNGMPGEMGEEFLLGATDAFLGLDTTESKKEGTTAAERFKKFAGDFFKGENLAELAESMLLMQAVGGGSAYLQKRHANKQLNKIITEKIGGVSENVLNKLSLEEKARIIEEHYNGLSAEEAADIINKGAGALDKFMIEKQTEATKSTKGRAMLAETNPEAADAIRAARREGKDISRKMIRDLGLSEKVLGDVESRNKFGDALLEDGRKLAAKNAAKMDGQQEMTLRQEIGNFTQDTSEAQRVYDRIVMKLKDASVLDDPYQREQLVMQAAEAVYAEDQARRVGGARQKARMAEKADHEARLAEAEAQAAERAQRAEKDAQERTNAEMMARETKRYNDFMLAREEARAKGGLNEARTDETPAKPDETAGVTPPAGEAARLMETGEAQTKVGGEVVASKIAPTASTSASTETKVNTPPTTTESAEGGSQATDAVQNVANKKTAREAEKAEVKRNESGNKAEVKKPTKPLKANPKKAAEVVKEFVAKGEVRSSIKHIHHDHDSGLAVATNGSILIATKHGYDPDYKDDSRNPYPNWRQVVPSFKKGEGQTITIDPNAVLEATKTVKKLASGIKSDNMIRIKLPNGEHTYMSVYTLSRVAKAMAANGITEITTKGSFKPLLAKNNDTTIVAMPLRNGDGDVKLGRNPETKIVTFDLESGKVISAPESKIGKMRRGFAEKLRADIAEGRAKEIEWLRTTELYKGLIAAQKKGKTDAKKVYEGITREEGSWDGLSESNKKLFAELLATKDITELENRFSEYSAKMKDSKKKSPRNDWVERTPKELAKLEKEIAAEDAIDAMMADAKPKTAPKSEPKAETNVAPKTEAEVEPKSEAAPTITPAEAMKKLGTLGAADVDTLTKAMHREERLGHTERANMIRVLRDYKRGVGTNSNPQSDETSGGKYRASVEAAKPLDDPAFVAWAKKRGVAPTTQKRNEYDKAMADTLTNRLSRWIKGVTVEGVNFIAPEEGGDVRAAKEITPAVTEASGHHSEGASQAGVSINDSAVALNRKPTVVKENDNIVRFSVDAVKRHIQSYENGDRNVNVDSLPQMLQGLGRMFGMRYKGRSRYATYEVKLGNVTLRLSEHNANGANFANDPEGSYVSVYIEGVTYPHKRTTIPYTEIRYSNEIYLRNPRGVANEIVSGVKSLLDNGDFETTLGLGEKKVYPVEITITPAEDAAYLDAVKRGDTKTAERMVREAAAKAMPDTKVVGKDGLPLVVYHTSDWNPLSESDGNAVFDSRKIKEGSLGRVFYFSREQEGQYGKNATKAYLNLKNPFNVDKDAGRVLSEKESERFYKALDGEVLGEYKPETMGELFAAFKDESAFPDAMRAIGYDGIIDEGRGYFGAFDSNQIKSVEITSKGDGNVIPLSQRFNPENNDIRYLHDGERIVGSYNRATGEVKLAKGASVETVLHELGWHAARHWAEVNADSDPKAKALLEQMKKYAESAPKEIKDAVRDVYGDLDADTLLDEIGAHRFVKDQSGKIAEALATKEGAAWYQKVWNKVVDFFKNFLTKIGYNRVDLDGVENMSPEVFGDFLADVMMSGKQLGERTAFSMEAPKGLAAKWTNNLSDYKAPIAELEKRVTGASNNIYYLARTLEGMAQRGKNRAERAIKRVEKILGEDISPELLAQYMQLKAYEERNAKIERRNGKADASGMTPEDARAIEKTINESGVDEAIFEEAAQILWDLQKEGLQARVDAGLLDQETANKWMTDEPHHIPWKDAVDPDSGEYVGRRLGASEFDTAEGRKTAASGDPITWMLQEYQDAMTRAAQNRLRSAIANLTRLNGDVGIIYDGIQTDSKGKRSFIKYPRGGGKAKVLSIPEGVKIESTVKNDGGMKNVLTFKEGGETKYLVLNGTLGEAVAGAVTGRTLARPPAWISWGMRAYAATATALSPTFALRNLTADNFDIHNYLVSKNGFIKGEKMFAKVFAEQGKMFWPLMRYVYTGDFKFGKNGELSKFQKLVEAYEEAGGLIGGMATEGYDATVKQVQAKFRAGKNKVRAVGEGVIKSWLTLQRMSELGPRLAIFKAGIDSGMSAKDAAMMAREATVDFNKKGEKTPWFNTLWMFSNSALGSNLTQLKNINTRAGITLLGGWCLYGFAEGLVDALLGGDDDELDEEGLATGEDVSEYTRKNSLYIRNGSTVYRANIHMGSFAYAKYFGNCMARVAAGKMDSGKAAKELTKSGVEISTTLTGLGNVNAEAFFQTAVPTLAQTFTQIGTGVDYAGREMYRKKYTEEHPDSSYGRSSTPQVYHNVAKWLNRVTGGNEARKGWIDLRPETLQALTEMVGKNFARDVVEISETGYKVATGDTENLDIRNVPFAGDFVRTHESNANRFYEAYNMYRADKYELKNNPELKGEARRKFLKERPWLYSAGKPGVTRIDNIVKRIEKLRDIEESDRATEERKAEAKAMRRKLQARVIEIMKGK